MGRSLSAHSAGDPDGRFTRQASGSVITISHKDGKLHHRIEEAGLTADYPIAYSIGVGQVGRSFLIELGGNLFQSPASYYSEKKGWDVSPGYETQPVLDFNRSIDSSCLTCHAGTVKQTAGKVVLEPITCERCHGPSAEHLRRPTPGSILNPAKLTGRQRDSVCEQCHLEGATVVLNPGKTWSDFRPGETLERTESHYFYQTNSPDAAVSHAEQLSLSACLRRSNGRLWCGTCHNPHPAELATKRKYEATCRGCHAAPQLASFHKPGQEDCLGCHMPKRKASDIAHAAITDHRIERRPTPSERKNEPKTLTIWQSADPEFADRNRGLALFHTRDYAEAYRLLQRLPKGKADSEVLSAEGYLLLGSGQAAAAIEKFKAAIEEPQTKPEYLLDLGVAFQSDSRKNEAIESFRRAIREAPYDYRAYLALYRLYQRDGQTTDAESVRQQFLRLWPESIVMRLP